MKIYGKKFGNINIFTYLCTIIKRCSYGGIGIHKGLKIPRPLGLGVQIPLGVLKYNMSKNRKHLCTCQNCGKEFYAYYSSSGKFCSNKCQQELKSKQSYKKIIEGDASIMRANYNITPVVYKYLMKEQGYKCAICGLDAEWQGNPLTFIVDHIDGNAANNKRDNLRCVCPNCDSQLDTYKNTGNRISARRHRTNKLPSSNG